MAIKLYQNKTWLYKKYVAEGKTVGEIADMLDVSHQTIYRYVKKFGFIRNPRRFS